MNICKHYRFGFDIWALILYAADRKNLPAIILAFALINFIR